MRTRSVGTAPTLREGRRRGALDEVIPYPPASLSRMTRSESRMLSQDQEVEVLRCEESEFGRPVRATGVGKWKWEPFRPLRRSPRLAALKSSAGEDIGKIKFEPCKSGSSKVTRKGRKSPDLCGGGEGEVGAASSVGNMGLEGSEERSVTIGVRTRSMDRSWSVPKETVKGEIACPTPGVGKTIAVGISGKRFVTRRSKSCKPPRGKKVRDSEALKRQNHGGYERNSAKSDANRRRFEDAERKVMANSMFSSAIGSSSMRGRGGGERRTKELVEKKDEMPGIAGQECETTAISCCWTEEQEAALRAAYLAAKPTPNFWKKVARMVPGKTSQECFERIHAKLLTPQQSHSRCRKYTSHNSPLSHLSLSGGILRAPTNRNVKKTNRFRRKARNAQKIVRHLLSKHQITSKGYEADLFSILEDDADISNATFLPANMFSTPGTMAASFSPLRKCQQSSSCGKDLTSPPVLKRVKNMALHEKFIDQLHLRDERRKKVSNKGRSTFPPIQENKENELPYKAVVKAAKSALACDATDFVRMYKKNQETCVIDDEDLDAESNEDELEEEI